MTQPVPRVVTTQPRDRPMRVDMSFTPIDNNGNEPAGGCDNGTELPPHQQSSPQLQPPMRMHIPPTGTVNREATSGDIVDLDDVMNLQRMTPTFPGQPTKRRHRRRRWRRRKLIVRKRRLQKGRSKQSEEDETRRPLLTTRQKKRHNKKKELSEVDNTNTIWLKGAKGEPRLSLQYRIKVGNKHVTTGAVIATANVRTLRQKRKVGYSGHIGTSATKNNWKIPMLKHLMQTKGIYLMGLQETRRTSGILDVGDGYLLVTSQNEKYSWLGGTGFLLSPSAAEAFRATNCQTWSPPTGSEASGRYLEINLASATKKEGVLTFGNGYGPTAQSTMEVRKAFWDIVELRMSGSTVCGQGCTTNETEQTATAANKRKRPSRRIYIAVGDWNARVGRRDNMLGQAHDGVLGPHNFPELNANGSMMLDTMTRCGMKIANTFFEHDKSHTATWTHNGTKKKHVLDHVLVKGWQMRHVLDVRARPGWNVDSDHEVCSVTLRGNPRGQRADNSNWKTGNLKTRKGRLNVDVLLEENFSTNPLTHPDSWTKKIGDAMEAKLESIESVYDFDMALREVGESILPKQETRKLWSEVDKHRLEAALKARRRAVMRAAADPCEATAQGRKDAEKSLRRITRSAMYRHFAGMCNKMKNLAEMGKGLSRNFFRELSNVKKFLGCYEKPKQELVGNVEKRVSEMDSFFKKRFCQGRPQMDEDELLAVPPIQGIDVDSIFSEPTDDEILRATMALKNGKTADIVGLQAELLKAATRNRAVGKKFIRLVLAIWRGETMPNHWLQSLGCTIWKNKHPKSNLKNWRVVNLIAISSKVASKLLHWRMQRLSTSVWSQTQYGFRPGSWTMDAVFVVTRLMEDFRKYKRVEQGEDPESTYMNTLYLMFEDYSTAFDGVPRELLWKLLRKIYKIPDNIVDLLKRFHDGFRTHSVVNNKYGKGYVTTSGVRQGCVTGPDLWNMHMQVVLWALAKRMIDQGATHGIELEYFADGKIRAKWEKPTRPGQKGNVEDVTFADDSAVPADGLDNVGVFEEFKAASTAGGSEMSLDNPATGAKGKTKMMKVTGEPGDWEATEREKREVTCGGVEMPFVDKFLYLGCLRSTERDLGVMADIERRLTKGTAVMATLMGLWRSKSIPRSIKGKLMLTYAIPTALYGVSCWVMTSRTIRRLKHWWFKMCKWAHGVHNKVFQDTGLTAVKMRKNLGVEPIMTYVKRNVITQIGHIARKSIENPAKQLLFGWVSGRKMRRGGARGRRKKNPQRTLQEYYKTVLMEIPHPDFDMRIWSLMAQDRNLWRKFAHSVTGVTHLGGGRKRSLANRTDALQRWRREAKGDDVTTHDPTLLRPNRLKHSAKCPLRCGWQGEGISRHIQHEHPLHPVCYECVECNEATRSWTQAIAHMKVHGGAEVSVKKMDGDNYKWDHRKGFLRAIPKGQTKPRPEGWLHKTFKKSLQKTGPTRVDSLWEWNGVGDSERQRRSDQRDRILGDAPSWRALDPFKKWRWLKTIAASEGWTKYEQVATRQRVDNRSRMTCSRNCGWNDHTKSTIRTCPLHPGYVGHLKAGGKPKGVRGGSEEADEWRRKQDEEALRREAAANVPGELVCRNEGCEALFRTKKQRLKHESAECRRTRDGRLRRVLKCDVPGCKAAHVSESWMKTHMRDCRKTFEFDSPTCPSCGLQVNDRVVRDDGTEVVKGKARNAAAEWERHAKKFKRTRLVRCRSCGTPHLIPGCMATPRMMGRQFRCSDNFMKSEELFEPLEAECRRKRPREEGDPEWLERWRREVDSLDPDDNETESDAEWSAGSNEGEALGAAAAAAATNPQNDGERRINMLRGPPTTASQNAITDGITDYDYVDLNTLATTVATTATPGSGADRRAGRRRSRRAGRRRRRGRRQHHHTSAATAPTAPRGRWVGSGMDRFWLPDAR